MSRVWVRPLEGQIMRDPDTRAPLPAEGAEVELTTYWRRALVRGDVVRCEPPRALHSDAAGEPASSERGGSTSSSRSRYPKKL